MNFKQTAEQIQAQIYSAYLASGALTAAAENGNENSKKLADILESVSEKTERAALGVRELCESLYPRRAGRPKKPRCPELSITGAVEVKERILHIRLNTLLPHCRFSSPEYIPKTIAALLNDFEIRGGKIPYFKEAMLIIKECCSIEKRNVFDQDNKGWKTVANALKGRVFPDDDQYSLSVMLTSHISDPPACHIYVMDKEFAEGFFVGVT